MNSLLSVERAAVRLFLLESQGLLTQAKKSIHPVTEPETTMSIIQQLECVQLDPVSAVERNQHLVLAARNPFYKPEYLNQLLEQNQVFEYIANAACVIPMNDYSILEPIREFYRERLKDALGNVERVAQEVLTRLKEEGPLPSRAFRSSNKVHGYWDNAAPKTKDTSLALNLLLDVGIIRVVRREGGERFFHLAEQTVHKDELSKANQIDRRLAKQALIDKYIRAYRVFDAQDSRFGWFKMTAAERKAEIDQRVQKGTVVPLQIKDLQRQYYILAEDLERLQEIALFTNKEASQYTEGPVKFLPPLDNLLWRRERLVDLFNFHYKWEIYIPESKREYGYYVMPILYGDRLIGRMDPRLDRKNKKLVIRLLRLEEEVPITPQLLAHLREGLLAFAQFHQAKEIVLEKIVPDSLKLDL